MESSSTLHYINLAFIPSDYDVARARTQTKIPFSSPQIPDVIPQTKILEQPLIEHRTVDRNRNRKLEISTAPTKAKSREPAHSQALIQNKLDSQRSRSRESLRQAVRRLY